MKKGGGLKKAGFAAQIFKSEKVPEKYQKLTPGFLYLINYI